MNIHVGIRIEYWKNSTVGIESNIVMWLLGMVSGHLILQFSGKEQDVFYPQNVCFQTRHETSFPEILILSFP